ncbi:MAG TPA: hypothetical protein VGN04_14285 [Herbaspirillum sp.]|jgi:Kef-type K+ transport system membrane component KefB
MTTWPLQLCIIILVTFLCGALCANFTPGGVDFYNILFCGSAVSSHPFIAAQAPISGHVLFCGVALSISAMPVMARIVMDLRMEGTCTAAIALTAALALRGLRGLKALRHDKLEGAPSARPASSIMEFLR